MLESSPTLDWMEAVPELFLKLHARHGIWERRGAMAYGHRGYKTAAQHELYCMMQYISVGSYAAQR